MADIYVNNAPFINKWFYVTGAFGESRSGGRVHRGLDLAPAGYSGSLYAIDDFTIQYIGFDATGYGNYFIANNGNGMMYLYAHMASIPPSVGTHIAIHGYVGECGNTGSQGTGYHVHIEMQQGTTWQYGQPLSSYVNPCTYLTGINNVVSYTDRYWYDGTPTPPTPTGTNKHKFPWYIYEAQGLYDE